MHSSEKNQLDCPILVISYDDIARAALAASLATLGVRAEHFSTFCEAESFALRKSCRGILVDLAAMIKAKAEEKVVAYSMARLYPILRVKTMGAMLIPMAMAGDARQEKSLSDFLTKSCAEIPPRRLRSCRRKAICIPIYIEAERGFTLNISWSGVFIADMNPERFSVGDVITVTFPDFGLEVEVIVSRIQGWGQHLPPGIGVMFRQVGQELENNLFALLKSDKDKDHDRLVS
jgi:hypothetical protein